MALPPLATVADLTARGMTLAGDETALAETYLAVASASVREAAGVAISQDTSTVDLAAHARPWFLPLPGSPVTRVSEVHADGQPVSDWALTAGPALWRPGGWFGTVTVTFTHGLAEVPADIVDLVCRITATALVAVRAEADGAGIAVSEVRSERLGDYSVTYADTGRVSDMELPDYLRHRLARRFGRGAAMVRTR